MAEPIPLQPDDPRVEPPAYEDAATRLERIRLQWAWRDGFTAAIALVQELIGGESQPSHEPGEVARMQPAFTVDPDEIRDIAPDVLDHEGRLRVLPAAAWSGTTRLERGLLGHKHGLYSYPTTELVDYLRKLIGGRSAIEIGAGHGVLADALGIPGTDSYQQAKEPYRSHYASIRHPTVPYGPHVIDADAATAVRRYRPEVVIGCWVTHRWDPARPELGGNEVGIDEMDILRRCSTYVLVGNEKVHQHKPIWALPHRIEYPPWLYSRAMNDSRDFVAIWEAFQVPGSNQNGSEKRP